jgi:hypothetical protein
MKLEKCVGFSGSVLIAALLLGLLMSGTALAKKDELPEVDSDGLHLQQKTRVRAAYAVPGVDLSVYDKVKILDCYVDFVKDWEKDYNLEQIGLSGRVRDKDADAIKARLAAEFNKVFTKVLTEKGFPVVDDVGPDVLLLRPALVNVDVTAPDLLSAGFQTTIVQSAGSMTLYMEMYDSATSKLLARVIDPEADDRGFAQAANRATNQQAADRLLRDWAELLAKHLGEATQ